VNTSSFEKTVKFLMTKNFELGLYQDHNDTYFIRYESRPLGKVYRSETLVNLDTAIFMFDLKLKDLEGN